MEYERNQNKQKNIKQNTKQSVNHGINQKVNYQIEMEKLIKAIPKGTTPKLLLHSCCAPCSSYVLEYLSVYFEITVFYYNPNIYPESEFHKRTQEQQKLIEELKANPDKNPDKQTDHRHPIHYLEGTYDRERFYEQSKGLEEVPEGGARCERCFALRLSESAKVAKENGFDYFTTTLSISPLKNSQNLNRIGIHMGEKYGIPYLMSDFKKKNGYKRSVELSNQYGLYRQDYCGCEFSYLERERQKEKNMEP